jgi:hypothetical protein
VKREHGGGSDGVNREVEDRREPEKYLTLSMQLKSHAHLEQYDAEVQQSEHAGYLAGPQIRIVQALIGGPDVEA